MAEKILVAIKLSSTFHDGGLGYVENKKDIFWSRGDDEAEPDLQFTTDYSGLHTVQV